MTALATDALERFQAALLGGMAEAGDSALDRHRAIGMGYVRPDLAAPGTKLAVRMQNALWPAEVVEDSPHDPTNARIRVDG